MQTSHASLLTDSISKTVLGTAAALEPWSEFQHKLCMHCVAGTTQRMHSMPEHSMTRCAANQYKSCTAATATSGRWHKPSMCSAAPHTPSNKHASPKRCHTQQQNKMHSPSAAIHSKKRKAPLKRCHTQQRTQSFPQALSYTAKSAKHPPSAAAAKKTHPPSAAIHRIRHDSRHIWLSVACNAAATAARAA